MIGIGTLAEGRFAKIAKGEVAQVIHPQASAATHPASSQAPRLCWLLTEPSLCPPTNGRVLKRSVDDETTADGNARRPCEECACRSGG